ncbi:MAG: 2,3-bisphosphoglycerate-independent phosphoglycerate mutase [Bacilli bacterium]|nr:2,3-bisphosphoglycerate-independent phosphoglycerate mutase [Bacilli bacterium]
MKKVLLIVLDGFGIRDEVKGNAIKNADMPNFNSLWEKYPHSLLEASGEAVGLEKGQMGNSEIGHLSIGAGRLIKQNIAQINDMFVNNELDDNDSYKDMVSYAKLNNKPIHIMALISDGGIHSHIRFVLNMIEKLHKDNISNVYVHSITDGRDTDVHSSYKYISQVEELLTKYNMGHVVSVCGRYYAMDRDKKWNRTKYYSDMVTLGKGVLVNNLEETINICYKKGVTDEFLPPILLDKEHIIKDGDVLLWFNFRPDRAKQIMQVITDDSFNEYPTLKMPNLKVYTIYKIDEAKNSKNLLNHIDVENPLGVYISTLGLTQARIAETEKYAHVTYFFDGGRELQLDGCDRFLIPSPKVATYDLKPEMSAFEITRQVTKCLNENYDFILVNFANSDMVGHTGNYDATIKALEAIDNCLGNILEYATENFYTIFLTADHGNADYMQDENGNMITTHSTYPVPFIVTDKKVKLVNGSITNIAPTILKYMDIKIPKEMKDSEVLFDSEEE